VEGKTQGKLNEQGNYKIKDWRQVWNFEEFRLSGVIG
jgi:hypothetical protein